MAACGNEVLLDERLGLAQTVLREDHGFRFVGRIAGEAALTKTIECIPI
jgi:hypothetical protein